MNLHWCIEQLRNVRDVDPLGDAEVCDEVAILIHDMERRHWWRVAVDDVAALQWQKQSRDDPGISGRGSEAKDTAAGVGHARIAQQNVRVPAQDVREAVLARHPCRVDEAAMQMRWAVPAHRRGSGSMLLPGQLEVRESPGIKSAARGRIEA